MVLIIVIVRGSQSCLALIEQITKHKVYVHNDIAQGTGDGVTLQTILQTSKKRKPPASTRTNKEKQKTHSGVSAEMTFGRDDRTTRQ